MAPQGTTDATRRPRVGLVLVAIGCQALVVAACLGIAWLMPRLTGGPAVDVEDGTTWRVAYRATDDPSRANDDGSLSEWEPGWFIAHDWSNAGREIAVRPERVVVDGVTYRYDASRVVPSDADARALGDWAAEGGSVVFQTCTPDDWRLLVRYRPETDMNDQGGTS